MPYVQRDTSGRISAIFQKPGKDAEELLANDHPDILGFLGGIVPQIEKNQAPDQLTKTDISLIRVIEDLVDTLIAKNVITLTDLPLSAREKIMQRKSTRERIFGTSDIIESEDKLF
jgi:hypothetical protein